MYRKFYLNKRLEFFINIIQIFFIAFFNSFENLGRKFAKISIKASNKLLNIINYMISSHFPLTETAL